MLDFLNRSLIPMLVTWLGKDILDANTSVLRSRKKKRVLDVLNDESSVPLDGSGANILNRGILEEMTSK